MKSQNFKTTFQTAALSFSLIINDKKATPKEAAFKFVTLLI